MDAELVRAYADELAFLTARLNRRAGEMEGMDPVSEFLVREMATVVHNLQVTAGLRSP